MYLSVQLSQPGPIEVFSDAREGATPSRTITPYKRIIPGLKYCSGYL